MDSDPLGDREFGSQDYSCVDYGAGAIVFSGQTLTYDVDLSNDGCGCNAALYLVSMPQSKNASTCSDFYCDANDVCGVRCTEIDLMEANKVAFVSTVHVEDDGSGQGFGYAHYVMDKARRLHSPDAECAYGPAEKCAINTNLPFRVAIQFSPSGEDFSFEVRLTQDGRRASLGPVRYIEKPQKGMVDSATAANAALRASLDAGMTLVVSHWGGPTTSSMSWLDAPCTDDEISGWACTDEFVERVEPWLCDSVSTAKADCTVPFKLSTLAIESPSPSPPAAPPPSPPAPPAAPPYVPYAYGTLSLGVTIGLFVGLLLGGALGYAVAASRSKLRLGRAQADIEAEQPMTRTSSQE